MQSRVYSLSAGWNAVCFQTVTYIGPKLKLLLTAMLNYMKANDSYNDVGRDVEPSTDAGFPSFVVWILCIW